MKDTKNNNNQLLINNKEVILDQHHLFVSDEKYHAFMQILEQPLSNNVGFKKLMGYKAPWKSQLKT
ncbi:DUF1778 domain-containing protein [Xenorhabdus sp. PB62.4]|uniref:type II toxin-antitoxin system TacA family antitoxin n=1 Tax=Xenorhabdus sp. PB62.4 TaxID=1851573 RepID=UPI0016569BDC|nr:DUF1778 domain-containing protein [Xenorhabdus sp. PB62.4]MBC8953588.1 hypothetical protein [Xenorhabdus sp. PB62.4]